MANAGTGRRYRLYKYRYRVASVIGGLCVTVSYRNASHSSELGHACSSPGDLRLTSRQWTSHMNV